MQPQSYTGPLFYVRSSEPTRFYAVTVNPATDLYACECADHVYRARDCKHIRRVVAGQVTAATPKRAQAPATVRADTGLDLLRDIIWRED